MTNKELQDLLKKFSDDLNVCIEVGFNHFFAIDDVSDEESTLVINTK